MEVNVHLFDQDSLILNKPSLQCRYFFILLNSPEPEIENLQKLCVELAASRKNPNNNNFISFEEILNNYMMKLSVIDEGEGIHKINFFLQKSGLKMII